MFGRGPRPSTFVEGSACGTDGAVDILVATMCNVGEVLARSWIDGGESIARRSRTIIAIDEGMATNVQVLRNFCDVCLGQITHSEFLSLLLSPYLHERFGATQPGSQFLYTQMIQCTVRAKFQLIVFRVINLSEALVRAAGLEPARAFAQRILSPLRLPFRHAREGAIVAMPSCGVYIAA